MKNRKAKGRLAARRAAHDAHKFPPGTQRPGSLKKPFPRGRFKSHKAR